MNIEIKTRYNGWIAECRRCMAQYVAMEVDENGNPTYRDKPPLHWLCDAATGKSIMYCIGCEELRDNEISND